MKSTGSIAVAALVLLACGGGTDSAEYAGVLEQAKARVDAYEAAVVADPSAAACAAERTRYTEEMGSLMERMRRLGGGMQTCMGGMMGGGMRQGGMMGSEEGCRRMDDELATYANAGCASADPSVNLQEGLAHCTRMRGTLTQMAPRDCGP